MIHSITFSLIGLYFVYSLSQRKFGLDINVFIVDFSINATIDKLTLDRSKSVMEYPWIRCHF